MTRRVVELTRRVAGRRRRLGPGLAWLVAGAAVMALAQLVLPTASPLYDGVINNEPYRYLDPTGSHPGNPSSYAADAPVTNGRSPQITAATAENPPQAQLIALDGVFAAPPGTTSLHVSIQPVEPAAPLSSGTISGNVYRIAVTDASGQQVPLAGSARPTLAMRSALPLADAAIFRLVGGTWTRLDTVSNAALSIYTAEPDALGDFAVVDVAGGGITTTTLVIAATVGVVAAAVILWALRAWMRRRAVAAPPTGRGRPGGRGVRGGSGNAGRRAPPSRTSRRR